jgi:hypothetical protein
MIATFIFCKHLSSDQSYNIDSFFKRCAVKSSTKTARTNPYWLVLMMSSIFKMNRSHDGAMSHRLKYLEHFFLIFRIAQLRKMIRSWFFFKRCTIESSTKTVWTTSYCKAKKSSKYLRRWDIVPSCDLFILNIEDIIRTSQYGFVLAVFVELFTAHLLKKESILYDWSLLRYLQKINVAIIVPHLLYGTIIYVILGRWL